MSVSCAYRSLLFAPADDAERLQAAFLSPADAVVADLEDGVAGPRKDEARRILADFLSRPPAGTPTCLVRINSPGTSDAQRDLELVVALRPEALVVPKATPEAIAALGPSGLPLIAVIETANGLRLAYEAASMPRVIALALGANDLGLSLGLETRADGQELLYARSKLVADSAAAGLRGPFDRVFPSSNDPAGLEADARLARSLGFRGKSALHADHPGIINRVFSGDGV
jgi:citrate lyase subunit beta/citryl-CoA lyase